MSTMLRLLLFFTLAQGGLLAQDFLDAVMVMDTSKDPLACTRLYGLRFASDTVTSPRGQTEPPTGYTHRFTGIVVMDMDAIPGAAQSTSGNALITTEGGNSELWVYSDDGVNVRLKQLEELPGSAVLNNPVALHDALNWSPSDIVWNGFGRPQHLATLSESLVKVADLKQSVDGATGVPLPKPTLR